MAAQSREAAGISLETGYCTEVHPEYFNGESLENRRTLRIGHYGAAIEQASSLHPEPLQLQDRLEAWQRYRIE